MRVLFCTDTYPPQVNGVSVVTALSVSGLSARGWECAVVAPEYPATATDPFRSATGGTAERERTSIASTALPIYPETRVSAPDYPAVADALRRFRPDLVHSETEFIIGRMGQIAARAAAVPMTSSYHTDFAKYAAAYRLPWLTGAVSAYIGRFHRRSIRTYTPSGPARDYLRTIGVPNVEVWGRGVDLDSFGPERRSDALRRELGLEGRTAFLYAGRLAAEKGVQRILDAYRRLRTIVDPDSVRLVVAGGGPQEQSIRESLPDAVVLLGYLDRARDLPALYASCDAFVFASLTETLGLVVLEAMASGLPVIAAPAGGVADHLRDGENGLAYAPSSVEEMAAAMARLTSDRPLRRTLSYGALRTAHALDWKRELDRLDVSLREVVAASGRRNGASAPERQPVAGRA